MAYDSVVIRVPCDSGELKCVFSPTRVSAVGVTSTVETTCATVTEAVPSVASVVAVIVAVPLSTAVTRPARLTVATPVADDPQMNVLPTIVSRLQMHE